MCKSKKSSAISRIPGVQDVCHKDELAKIFEVWQMISQNDPTNDLNFLPRTFICPKQMEEAKEFMRKKARPHKRKPFFIAKPSVGCQGTGIMLIQSVNDLPESMLESEFII